MYLPHYNFQQLPFRNTPDPRFFYETPRHNEALANLIYAVEQRRGFVLLSGEIGSGKTLVTHLLLQHLEDHAQIALIRNTHLNSAQLIRLICDEFSVQVHAQADKAAMLLALNQFLIQQLAEDRLVVVIIDEAQNLTDKVLEELRMLSNLETSSDKLLQIVLVGQPELRDKVSQPHLEQLRQRIALSYHLDPLTLDEITHYIAHRMRVAGPEHKANFTPEAIAKIARFSRGTPRIINGLCDNALLYGFTSDVLTIDEPLIDKVLKHSMHLAPRPHTPIRSPQNAYRPATPPAPTAAPAPSPQPSGPSASHVSAAKAVSRRRPNAPEIPSFPETADPALDPQNPPEATLQPRSEPAATPPAPPPNPVEAVAQSVLAIEPPTPPAPQPTAASEEDPDKKKIPIAIPPIIPFPALLTPYHPAAAQS